MPSNWAVKSAGIEAHGVNPKAIKAMAEVGVDISNHTSDLIDIETLNNATLVVTLCGDAADKCPMTASHVSREHWGFEDPAKASGTEEEKWQNYYKLKIVKPNVEKNFKFKRNQNVILSPLSRQC